MSPAATNLDTKFYRKSSRGLSGKNQLDADTARVFAAINENIRLSKVAALADVSTAVLWKAIAKLTRLGLIEDVDDKAGVMGRLFMDALSRELAKAVGPISDILLKNVTAQMDITLPNVPVELARELIFNLSRQIPDKKASAEFQQTILKEI